MDRKIHLQRVEMDKIHREDRENMARVLHQQRAKHERDEMDRKA
jgi:hypothetical protein